MELEHFDDLTRAVAQGVSRRHALKLLVASIFSGIGTLIGGRAIEAQDPVPSHKLFLPLVIKKPPVITFKIASTSEVQTILQEASQDQDFLALRVRLEEAEFTSKAQEGAFILEDGVPVTRIVVIHYQPSSPSNQAYLIFSNNNRNERIVFALNFNIENQIGVGLYRDAQKVVQVELNNWNSTLSKTPQLTSSFIPESISAMASESCQICLDTCIKTQQLQGASCVLRSTISAVSVGSAARKLFQVTEDIAKVIGNLDSLHGGLESIKGCITQGSLDCTANGGMCQKICTGCDQTGGVTCTENRKCVGGECRQPCGTNLCRASEICDGSSHCIPASESCPTGEIYVGMYRFGGSLRPYCCGSGNNCGAKPNGAWGGCCTRLTLCKPLGNGYKCCTPGLNC